MRVDLGTLLIGIAIGAMVSPLSTTAGSMLEKAEAAAMSPSAAAAVLGLCAVGVVGFDVLSKRITRSGKKETGSAEDRRYNPPPSATATSMRISDWLNGRNDVEAALLEQLASAPNGAQEALAVALVAVCEGSNAEERLAELARLSKWAATPGENGHFEKFVDDMIRRRPAASEWLDEFRRGIGRFAKHAHRSTRLIAALAGARRHAVVPCSEFLWLKAVDRTAWYALNNLGRTSFHVEGLGPIAHWLAESDAERSIIQPDMSSAAKAVREKSDRGCP